MEQRIPPISIFPEHENIGFRYLALGDSYTVGEGELSANSFPSLLVQKLEEKGIKVGFQKIVAQTGWCTNDLMDAIKTAALKEEFDLVSLLIGVNNQYQKKDIAEYRIEFKALLQLAICLAKGRSENVSVLSIPDYGVTPFGSANEIFIGQQIDAYNVINKEIATSLGVVYCDITAISREAKGDSTLLCEDNLHPSAKMYARWVALLFPPVHKMLQN